MSWGQPVGQAGLDVAIVGSFGIPEIGIPLAAALTAVAQILRLGTSADDRPPAWYEDLKTYIASTVTDNTAKLHSDYIAGSYKEYHLRMRSLLWPEDDYMKVPALTSGELSDLRSFLKMQIDQVLLTSVAALEDPTYGKHFLTGLIMGQSLRLQYEKILMILDYIDDFKSKGSAASLSRSRIRGIIEHCNAYVISLGNVQRLAEAEAVHEKARGLAGPAFMAKRDEAFKSLYQGDPELGAKTLQAYRGTGHKWLLKLG